MKYLEFIKVVKESTNGTPNVRVCIQPLEIDTDYPGFDDISSKVDSIVALIQTQTDKGLYCKTNEYLLLYDFQALNDGQTDLYKINAVIKPQLEIDETHIIKGKPFELIVNVATKELIHKSKAISKEERVSKSQFLQQASKTSAPINMLYSVLIQTFLGKQPTLSMFSHSFLADVSLLHTDGYAASDGLEERRIVKRLSAVTQEFQTITLKEDGVKACLSKQNKMLPSLFLFLTFIKDLKSKSLDAVNSKRMPNIRVSTKSCRVNGVYQVPYYILLKMDCIMALIQAQIDKGLFCKKNQFLLLYNFQPLQAERFGFYSIDMVIKPISKISETDVIEGQPLQLVVNGITNEVMNNTKAMVELGLISGSQVLKQGLEPPTSYGNYHQYAKTSDITELIKIKPKPLLNGTVHIKEKTKVPAKPLTFSAPLSPSSANKNLGLMEKSVMVFLM